MRRFSFLLACVALLWAAPAGLRAAAPQDTPAPIQDNSFLIEEAYNQEDRVVQHISAWTRFEPGGEWLYTFTQEWPAFGQRHQLSYTVPLHAHETGAGPGLGDVLLNYRYQWRGVGGGPLAVSPRVSTVLPTGRRDRGLGAGAAGVQLNLPVSLRLARGVVVHSNAGATWTGESDALPSRRSVNLGQSLVWLARRDLNLLVELVWDRSEALGGSADDREEHLLVSPGIRWAHDFESGLQIVPGMAVPIGVGPSRDDRALLLYLSFEHGF